MFDVYMRDEDLDAVEVAIQRTRKAQRKAAKAMGGAKPAPATIPADMAKRVQAVAMAAVAAEFDGILADLRSGAVEPLVKFCERDHDIFENEYIGR